MSATNKGYIYIFTNEAMPGLIKIGITDKDDINERLRELDTTGVPMPFECHSLFETKAKPAKDIEAIIHSAFHETRVRKNREFFRKSADRIVELISNIYGVKPIRFQSKWKSDSSVLSQSEKKVENGGGNNGNETNGRRQSFSFELIGVPVGATLHYFRDHNVTCVVKDTKTGVELNGDSMSLGHATAKVYKGGQQAAFNWEYNGVKLLKMYHKVT